MRIDWLLIDDGVLDGGSDWFRGTEQKPGVEELTIQNYPNYGLGLLTLETHHIDQLFHKPP